MPKQVRCSAVYPTHAVPDVAEACSWYVEKLGFSLSFQWGEPPTHAAIALDQARIHFWQGDAQLGENWIYFDVSDLETMYERAKSNGVEITKPPEDYPWGMREFNAVDLNGYKIRFGQHVGGE